MLTNCFGCFELQKTNCHFDRREKSYKCSIATYRIYLYGQK
jgi:hypothetical protein